MTKEQIRAFLEQPEIQLLVADEDLEEVYNKCHSSGRKDLTEYLLSIGVQPDEYMDHLLEGFLRYSQITSYDISSTVTTIGNYAFFNCDSLTRITIPDSVTTIDCYAFGYCSSLTSIIIPDSVTIIGKASFRDCDALTSVTISNSATSIGDYAFYNCRRLKSITIPDSVAVIGECAFYNCGNIEIYYGGTKQQWEIVTKVGAFKHNDYVVHCADGDIIVD